jgi:Protein of unknown function (DUF3558)
MSNRGRLWAVVALGLLVSSGLQGCSSIPATPSGPSSLPSPTEEPSLATPSRSPLPPRPLALQLDGIDPCSLLTPKQGRQFTSVPSRRVADDQEPGTYDCIWSTFPTNPVSNWTASAVLDHGAEYYLGSVTSAQIVQVDGFAAVQTSSNLTDPEKQCLLYVDVAPGQALDVQYINSNGDYPGINHQVACRLASKAAELMVANLRNLVH